MNNAGIDQPPDSPGGRHHLHELPIDEFRRMVEVNLLGTFQVTQVFGERMAARGGGSIINIGSLYASVSPDANFYAHLAGNAPFIKSPAYGASKAAVVNLSKFFATHWAGRGVRVNTLSPGGVLAGQDEEFKAKYGARVPLGRMAHSGGPQRPAHLPGLAGIVVRHRPRAAGRRGLYRVVMSGALLIFRNRRDRCRSGDDVSIDLSVPAIVPNQVGGHDRAAADNRTFSKMDPATGRECCRVARSSAADVQSAVECAKKAQPAWASTTVVKRGEILRRIAMLMQEHRGAIADLVARETGKSRKDALGETDAAIEMGFFVAGEGRRFYGQTTTSAVPNKSAMIVRQPLGVAGLIIAANTPIANVAWKAFPALLCGNSAILKAAEDTPLSAWAFGVLAREAGIPEGVYTTLHGFGEEAGAPLVEHPDVAVVSFTGSCEVGRWIAETAGRRLAKTCLELGGKNPLIVCDDADLQNAVTWTLGSAFSNAGQRCAAGSRIIVFDGVYDRFKAMLVAATEKLKVGTADTDDYGPVINEDQMTNMLGAVARAKAAGATVITGGQRLTGAAYGDGYFVAPTIIEQVGAERRDHAQRAVRSDHVSVSRRELRGGDHAGQRFAVRAHGVDSHAEHQPGDDVPEPDSVRCRGGERRDLRQRAASAVRRPASVRQRLARSRHAGDRRVLRSQDDLHQSQPESGLMPVQQSLFIPGASRLEASARERTCACSGGHPMIAYTIGPALESQVFDSVIVSTDSEEIAAIARHYGAEVPFLRPAALASDTSPDIEWLEYTLAELGARGRDVGLFQPAAPDESVSHRGDDSPRVGERSRRSRASIRCARSSCAPSIRARCGWCAASGCFRCCHSGSRGRPKAARTRDSRGTVLRIRRCRRCTCRTPRSRSRGRAWSGSAGRLPATCWCRSSPKATKASTSTMPLTGWWPSACSPTEPSTLPARGQQSRMGQ